MQLLGSPVQERDGAPPCDLHQRVPQADIAGRSIRIPRRREGGSEDRLQGRQEEKGREEELNNVAKQLKIIINGSFLWT